MNTYAKYCPNVFVAKCSEKHESGETILLETKYGNSHECVVYNLVKEGSDGFFYYSIVRADGFNSQEWAKRKADKAKEYESRVSYWEKKASSINLSMPESLEFYEFELEKAIQEHSDLKNGAEKSAHSYSITYANKKVKDLKSKIEMAKKLWS
jgi:hypothetical protein